MKRVFFSAFNLLAFSFSLFSQECIINEIMTANASAFLDTSFYNFSEWIEIYNPSSEIRSIEGYYISNDSSLTSGSHVWKVPPVSLPAKGYSVIWFDKMNVEGHASFRIRSNRELLQLYDNSGKLIDSVRMNFPYQNCSYGRSPDGSSTWNYFIESTPGASNTSVAVQTQSPDPEFSVRGGRYSGLQTIALSIPAEGYTIRYTTDGSEPTGSSSVYEHAIDISATTTIKARAFAEGKIPSHIIVNTYFIDEHEFTIPMVSLSMDPKYLWDDTIGIYTDGTNGIPGNGSDEPKNWNQDWERFAHVEFFQPDGSRYVNTDVGVKIGGAYSRAYDQKSFSLYFRDKYGADNIRYPFFQSKQTVEFASLMLRNSGLDNNRTMFHDALVQTLLIGEMDVDYSAYTPAAMYMNGNYWGILNIREKTNEDYIQSNYGIDEDSIDFLENDQEIVAGSRDDYSELIDFISASDLALPSNYQYIKDRIDVDEYINYLIAEIYCKNTDWPGNNLKYWKPKSAGGKWRWIISDMDFCFGILRGIPSHNTLAFALSPNPWSWANPPWATLLIRKLMQNDEFRNQFINRFIVHIYSTYNPLRVNRIIDSLRQNIVNEIPYHLERWGGWMNTWENYIDDARYFTSERPMYMMAMLQNQFGLKDPNTIKIRSNLYHTPFVSVNDIVVNDTLFEGRYMGERPIRIVALQDNNYRFKKWTLRSAESCSHSLIAARSQWKYLDNNIPPDEAWTTLIYDDYEWKSGNGQFGFGNGNETTTLEYGDDENNKYITYYFRKKFTVQDPENISTLNINLLMDDGAIVYLNGQEVINYNIPRWEYSHNTLAVLESYDTTYLSFTLADINLHAGENIIAVEIHQNSVTSSDLSFDLFAVGKQITGIVEETSSKPEINLTLNDNLECYAEFEKTDVVENLYINEICAKNTRFPDEKNEFDDWIELYNAGDDTINLAGLYLTNNLQLPTLFKISENVPAQTAIPPHSFKVLWADGQSEQGVLHLDFKLDKDGGEIGIAQAKAGVTYSIDTIIYPELKTDYSYGRYLDGTDRWFLLPSMTPGESNIYTGYEEIEDFSLTSLYPNPADEMLTVAFDRPIEKTASIIIYSLLGREEMRVPADVGTTRKLLDISFLPRGMYIVTIQNELSKYTTKLIKN